MTTLCLGFVPLVDCATLVAAKEKGFFSRHGLDVTLRREVSWANVRDKLAVGALDGAQVLAGMPIAASVGIDPVAVPTLTAFSMGLNGNAITVSSALWGRMCEADPEAVLARPLSARPLRKLLDADREHGRAPLRLAMVYPYSLHNYDLRYWLASAGIDPDEDVQLCVVPPPRMVESLERGLIDGFCVGEPWSSFAVRRGAGRIVITKYEIWNNSPEKVFAVDQRFAERNPEAHRALLRALIESAAWCDSPANRVELAKLLACPEFVGAPEPILTASLTGRLGVDAAGSESSMPDFHVFHRYAANFPWVSHAVWILAQMLRWGQLDRVDEVLAIARRVYRPDLYRAAARDLGLPAPAIDSKSEGTHGGAWQLDTPDGPITMGSDQFFDGGQFHPSMVVDELARLFERRTQSDMSARAAGI